MSPKVLTSAVQYVMLMVNTALLTKLDQAA
jgi:hypothetical protein